MQQIFEGLFICLSQLGGTGQLPRSCSQTNQFLKGSRHGVQRPPSGKKTGGENDPEIKIQLVRTTQADPDPLTLEFGSNAIFALFFGLLGLDSYMYSKF